MAAASLRGERLTDASLDHGQDILKECGRSRIDEPCAALRMIDGLDLLNHDKSGDRRRVGYGQVERKALVGDGDRAHDGQARVAAEEVVADDQRRSATSLFLPGLGVEGEGDEVDLPGWIDPYLPSLTALRRPHVDLTGLIVVVNPRYKLGERMARRRALRHDDLVLADFDLDNISQREVGELEDLLGEAEALAVALFEDSGRRHAQLHVRIAAKKPASSVRGPSRLGHRPEPISTSARPPRTGSA
jgi:hypothetical protein